MTAYELPDSPKMLREMLCIAQSAVAISSRSKGERDRLLLLFQRLIDECDRHRPLGQDGRHGDLHTATCGCEDAMSSVPVVPGDDRTACQHCSARVTAAGVNPDARDSALLECAPGLRHKPMPEIKAGR